MVAKLEPHIKKKISNIEDGDYKTFDTKKLEKLKQ